MQKHRNQKPKAQRNQIPCVSSGNLTASSSDHSQQYLTGLLNRTDLVQWNSEKHHVPNFTQCFLTANDGKRTKQLTDLESASHSVLI